MTSHPWFIKPIFAEAWQTFKRFNKPFMFASFILILVHVTDLLIQHYFFSEPFLFVATIIFYLLKLELTAGFLMMGVSALRDHSVRLHTLFAYFKKLPQLFIAMLLPFLVVGILMLVIMFAMFFLVSFLPPLPAKTLMALVLGLSASIAFSFLLFVPLLIIENKATIFRAWLVSIRMIWPYWPKLVGMIFLLALLNLLGLSLAGFGLLITLPLTYIIFAKLYLLTQQPT